MRVVLDSNVLVAAFATHGVCHEIFEHCLRNATIVCSDFIAGEVERTLVSKIKVPSRKAVEIIQYLKDQTDLVVPKPVTIRNLRDPNDQMVLATALSGRADHLITGDKDLLVLKKVEGVIIISPRDFWIYSQRG